MARRRAVKAAAGPAPSMGSLIWRSAVSSSCSPASSASPAPRCGRSRSCRDHCPRLPRSRNSTPARAARSTTTTTSCSPSSTSSAASSCPSRRFPKPLREAIIATEDARFYSHYGVDPIGIARAIYQNFRHGRIVEGGSTITQQLAKVLFLTPDKSLERKLKEAILAVELERRYSKDRILELYLNQIYFGHGAFGVEAAAQNVFRQGRGRADGVRVGAARGTAQGPGELLTVRTSGCCEAPARDRARTHGGDRYAQSRSSQARGRQRRWRWFRPNDGAPPASTFSSMCSTSSSTSSARTSSSRVGCTSTRPCRRPCSSKPSMRYEKASERWSRAGPPSPRSPPRVRPGASDRPEGAILALEPQTGYIKAMVGGYDFFKSEFNRAIQARRQPGSAFKPFVYIAALESGLTPASVVDDSPIEYPNGRSGKTWKPDNYDRKFRGPDHPAARDGGVGQRRGGKAPGASGHPPYDRGGPSTRRGEPSRREPLASRSEPPISRCSNSRRPMERSPTRARGCARRRSAMCSTRRASCSRKTRRRASTSSRPRSPTWPPT